MSDTKKVAVLSEVTYHYPAGNSAVERITLDLHQGEVVGLIGSNGAGKTTLLKLLAGYMDKTGGEIQLGGRPMEEFSNRKLNEFVTLVEQSPESQLVGPTVEDELARACRLMGFEGRVIKDKVVNVLKAVRMKHAREWFLDEMSCGERRRIALALALVSDPSLLLLDEPLADLDTTGIQDTVQTIRELKERGLSIVVSSHRMEDILDLTDRIAVLGEGRLLMIDEAKKVITNEEILKLAALAVPPIPRLFIRLSQAGLLDADSIPLNLEQAVSRLKEELGRRQEEAEGEVVLKP